MKKLFSRFRKDERGNIAIIFGMAVIPFMIAAGTAVDYGRAVVAKHRLQWAIDSAVLAAGSLSTATDAERQALGKAIFEANFPPSEYGLTVANDFITINNNIVSADESTAVNTTLMRLASVYDPLTEVGVQADSQATVPVIANAEVALVLDYSSSMWGNDPAGGGDKYEAMRDATIELIDSLTDNGDNTRVKFSLVPFSTHTYVTMPMEYIRTNMRSSQGNSSGNTNWTGCMADRDYPYSQNGDAPYTGSSSHSNYNKSRFGERAGYYSTRHSYYQSCHSSYTSRPLVRLTTNYTALKNQLNSMTPYGNTNISAAAAHGWLTLSPNAPFSDGVQYNHNDTAAEDDKVYKFMVILTDGEQTVRGEGYNGYWWSYGRNNLATLCNGMKGAIDPSDPDSPSKVTIITVGYDLYNSSTLNRLQNCASSPTNEHFINVNGSSGSISDAFQKIGQAISDMVYLSQ